jgi:competence protein ComEA
MASSTVPAAPNGFLLAHSFPEKLMQHQHLNNRTPSFGISLRTGLRKAVRATVNAALATLVVMGGAAYAAVDANKASQAELEAVKGIGPALSSKIVVARKTAAFKNWDDFVTRVQGVGQGSAAKLASNGLTVNGQSLAKAATPSAAKGTPSQQAKAQPAGTPARAIR